MDSPEITQARATLAQHQRTFDQVCDPMLARMSAARDSLAAAEAALDQAKAAHEPGLKTAKEALAALLRAEWRVVKPAEVKAMAILYGNDPAKPGIEVVSHRSWLDGNPGDEIFRAVCPHAETGVVYGETQADHAKFTSSVFLHVRRELLDRFRATLGAAAGGEEKRQDAASTSQAAAT